MTIVQKQYTADEQGFLDLVNRVIATGVPMDVIENIMSAIHAPNTVDWLMLLQADEPSPYLRGCYQIALDIYRESEVTP